MKSHYIYKNILFLNFINILFIVYVNLKNIKGNLNKKRKIRLFFAVRYNIIYVIKLFCNNLRNRLI